MPGDTGPVLPFEDGSGRQFAAIVADDRSLLAIAGYQGIEFARNPYPRQRCIRHQYEAFTAVVVNHREDTEPSAGT